MIPIVFQKSAFENTRGNKVIDFKVIRPRLRNLFTQLIQWIMLKSHPGQHKPLSFIIQVSLKPSICSELAWKKNSLTDNSLLKNTILQTKGL